MQSLNDLRFLYENYPELWQKLRYFQDRSYKPFRLDYTLDALERMFKSERELKAKTQITS